MVLDSSALVAILFEEAEAPAFIAAMDRTDALLVSTASLLETSMVVAGRAGEGYIAKLDDMISEAKIITVPFDEEQMRAARRAFLRYGKGRHAAGLNFGDCISYALARTTGEPLLFKGTDFGHTDIALVDLSA